MKYNEMSIRELHDLYMDMGKKILISYQRPNMIINKKGEIDYELVAVIHGCVQREGV